MVRNINSSSKQQWNIAIIVDGPELNKLQVAILEQVLKKYQVDIRFLLVPRLASTLNWNLFKNLLLKSSYWLQPQNLSSNLRGLRKIFFDPHGEIEDGTVSSFSEEFFKANKIDLVLSLSEKNYLPEVLQSARLGVLRYHFDATSDFRSIADVSWFQNVELRQYIHKSDGWNYRTLKSGRMRRYFEFLSIHVDGVVSAILPWMSQVIDEKTLFPQGLKPFDIEKDRFEIYWSWRFIMQVKFLVRAFFRKSRRAFFLQKWHVAVIEQPIKNLLRKETKIVRKWLPSQSKNKFIADPFPVFHEGQIKILVENYDYQTGKGVVEAINLDGSRDTASSDAIELLTHMSYPSMIVEKGALYCIPETLGEHEVAIYKCVKFPNKWKKVKVIFKDQHFSDPTMFSHDGKWWLLATKYDRFSGGNDQLFAWHSDEFLGDWKPHVQNPIKVDIGSARSAGMPFTVDGALYRPSQDCSKVYGGAVVINRIIKLSETEFLEEEVNRILPGRLYPNGCHHIAGYGDIAIIDGRTEEFSIRAPIYKIKLLLNRKKVEAMSLENFEQELLEDIPLQPEQLESFIIQTAW